MDTFKLTELLKELIFIFKILLNYLFKLSFYSEE